MKVLVTGCGRGGTNLGIELVRSFNYFSTTTSVEDRSFFAKGELPPLYATKLATENKGFNEKNLCKMMALNENLHIIFMLRHPLDILLSKIVRGRPRSQGGDSAIDQVATDGTPEGAARAIEKMFTIYTFLQERYPARLLTIKMENLTTNPDSETQRVSSFLRIPVTESTKTFYANNRNSYHQSRYKGLLHPQVSLHEDLEENFNGIFADKKDIVNDYKYKLEKITNHLSY